MGSKNIGAAEVSRAASHTNNGVQMVGICFLVRGWKLQSGRALKASGSASDAVQLIDNWRREGRVQRRVARQYAGLPFPIEEHSHTVVLLQWV
jgi:hypothetical protein